MFSFLKRKPKKEYEIRCPVCGREYLYKHNPDEITNYNFKYREGTGFVCSLDCDFCHAEVSVVQLKSGELDTVDNKWAKLEKEHTDEIDAAKSEIASVEEALEKDPYKERNPQLEQLEEKLKKLENIYNLQVKKYTDFQKEWRQEWQKEMEGNQEK